jgi:hypothetical protein
MAVSRNGLTSLSRPLAALCVVVVVCIALIGGSIARAPQARAATAPFGVASLATLIGGQYDSYPTDAIAIRNVGASWVRIVVPWNVLEPSPNAYNWAPYDYALIAAVSYGLKALILITSPAPSWAQASGSGQGTTRAPPADPANFGRVSRAIATRYGPWVSSREIWNEPNVPQFFNPVNVSRYGLPLQSAYLNIHAAQPNATVISGGFIGLE